MRFDTNSDEMTQIGRIYRDGDFSTEIRAMATDMHNPDKLVLLVATCDNSDNSPKWAHLVVECTKSDFYANSGESDKEVFRGDAENATFSYLERAFGVSC